MPRNISELALRNHPRLVIAAILSPTEIVANGGDDKDVREGQIYRIIDRMGIPITDPLTDQVIGKVPGTKYRLIVTNVQSKMAIMHLLSENGRDAYFLDNARTMSIGSGMQIASSKELRKHNGLTHAPVQIGDELKVEYEY